jgi:hypothetical protein
MTASYPASVKSFTTKIDGGTIFVSHVNDLQDEVAAIETAIGLNPQGAYADLATRIAAIVATAYFLGTNLDGVAATLIGFKAVINPQTDSYTTVAGDLGKLITMSKGSALTLTVHATAPAGWNCLWEQDGAGQLSIAASGGTIHNASGQTKARTQYSAGSLLVLSNAGTAPVVLLLGDTGV